MKRLFTTVSALLITLDLAAQGVVNFSNHPASDAEKVWFGDYFNPQNAGLAPVGSAYQVALYYDPLVRASTTDAAFIQIGAPANFGLLGVLPGVFGGGNRTIPVGNGGVVNFQVRGWATAFGSNYEQAFARGVGVGRSAIFRMDTAVGAEPVMGVKGTGTFTTGWTGFIIWIPEPPPIALGLVGIGAVLLLSRRR